MDEWQGSQRAAGCRFAIVVSRFNTEITDGLLAGAREALAEADVPADDVTIVRVPGAFELPIVAQRLAESGRFEAVICLGCLIKGDTMHFEYIADAATRGIAEVGLATGVPVTFGVLTTLTDEQAEVRARPDAGNKGREAALAAVEMATLLRAIDGGTGGMTARAGKPDVPVTLRHRAREAAVQMLYQWEVGRLTLTEVRRVWGEVTDEAEPLSPDLTAFANTLADGVTAHVAELDPLISEAAAHWRIERMNVIDRLVMRLAVYEFLHEPETPASVIINEALELARAFSSEESVPFVNGVLDGIRRRLERA